MRIVIVGTGYVGLSLATLLAVNNEVIAVDICPQIVYKINLGISPIKDEYIEEYFQKKQLRLTATMEGNDAYQKADIVIIATPTNFDAEKNYFDDELQ